LEIDDIIGKGATFAPHFQKMQKVVYQDLGLIRYAEAWEYQEQLLREVVGRKLENRKKPAAEQIPQQHYLLFCEHPPVYTLGKSGSLDHLLLNESELEREGFEFFKINRGGDITYHGPGQIVGYPIFDLDCFFTDVHKYVRFLEEVIILTLKDYGIAGTREKGYTGVWLAGDDSRPKRKICAIGVHLSRWVTMHGFAFNINTELSHFGHIVPCGIDEADKDVTSLSKELGKAVPIAEVKGRLKVHFAALFDYQYTEQQTQQAS